MNAIVLACSDGRLAGALDRFQEREGLAGADRVLVPGGPLPLARPGAGRRVTLDALRLLVDAHDARVIHVVSHQDCAAYERALGGVGFDQQELLERDLRRVKTLLETAFPEVEVKAWFVPWRENGAGAGFGDPVEVE